jgi:hypothetical protein
MTKNIAGFGDVMLCGLGESYQSFGENKWHHIQDTAIFKLLAINC